MLQEHLQTILSGICSHVELLGLNAAHYIFRLKDHKEAHMAFDIFNALGFEAKIYDEESDCRLYISKPTFDEQTLKQKLHAASTYTKALKQIQQSAQMLCEASGEPTPEYLISLSNNANNGKIIRVQMLHEKPEKELHPEVTADGDFPPPSPDSVALEPPPILTARQMQAARKKKKKEEFAKLGQPTLAKKHLMENLPNKGREKEATQRWIHSHFIRHVINNSTDILFLLLLLMLLSGVFITSRTILCPDFMLGEKKLPWYCDRKEIKKRFIEEEKLPPIPI